MHAIIFRHFRNDYKLLQIKQMDRINMTLDLMEHFANYMSFLK